MTPPPSCRFACLFLVACGLMACLLGVLRHSDRRGVTQPVEPPSSASPDSEPDLLAEVTLFQASLRRAVPAEVALALQRFGAFSERHPEAVTHLFATEEDLTGAWPLLAALEPRAFGEGASQVIVRAALLQAQSVTLEVAARRKALETIGKTRAVAPALVMAIGELARSDGNRDVRVQAALVLAEWYRSRAGQAGALQEQLLECFSLDEGPGLRALAEKMLVWLERESRSEAVVLREAIETYLRRIEWQHGVAAGSARPATGSAISVPEGETAK